MPRVKKETSAPAKKTAVKSFKINFQKPGEMPESKTVKAGSTVADIVADLNLSGYTISLNGSTVKENSTTQLAKDDVLRVGIKTKNN